MKELRATAKEALLYFLGIVGLAVVYFFGVGYVMSGQKNAASRDVREPTRMDMLVANAREIRAALERPLPPLEPLPPITQRPANAGPKLVTAKSRPRKLSSEARDALASQWSAPVGSYVDALDRHKPQ